MAYLTTDDNLEIARGNVDRLSSVNKFGANITSADDVLEDIWDGAGVYPFPTNTFATNTVQMNTPLANVFSTATAQCTNVVGADFADGTITCATVVAGDTVTFNGLVYTARSGPVASNSSFDISVDDDVAAESLAQAITNDTRVGTSALVTTASATTDTVTILASARGAGSNALTLVSSDGGTLAVSAATLTGGVTGDTVTINALPYTAVVGTKDNNTQFSADTGDNETAADLEDSVDADTREGTLSSVSASNATDTVTLTSSELGAAGDATTLTETGGTITLSGATFGSGVTADTITANALVYTFVTGVVSDFTEISVDTSNDAMATSFAAALAGDTREGTAGDLSGVAATDTVTLTTTLEGTPGNAVTLTSTAGARVVLGGATFSGGVFEVITKLSQTTNQAAMVGATIEIMGLDVNWDKVTQTKALDGSDTTTAVTLDTPLIRVNRMRVFADVVADSPIRAHNTAESEDYAIISIGKNQTLMAIYTTARNEVGYITNYYYSYIRDSVKDPDSVAYGLWLADRGNGYAFQIKNEQGLPKLTTATPHPFRPYLEVGEKTDIKVTSLAEAAAANVQGGFDLILEQI
jgi:hypothetical protein